MEDKYQEALENVIDIMGDNGCYERATIKKDSIKSLQQAIDKANKWDELLSTYDEPFSPITKDSAYNILCRLIDKNKELRDKAIKYDEKETPKHLITEYEHDLCCNNCEMELNYLLESKEFKGGELEVNYCPYCGHKFKREDAL